MNFITPSQWLIQFLSIRDLSSIMSFVLLPIQSRNFINVCYVEVVFSLEQT
jgi:hypothetical protein